MTAPLASDPPIATEASVVASPDHPIVIPAVGSSPYGVMTDHDRRMGLLKKAGLGAVGAVLGIGFGFLMGMPTHHAGSNPIQDGISGIGDGFAAMGTFSAYALGTVSLLYGFYTAAKATLLGEKTLAKVEATPWDKAEPALKAGLAHLEHGALAEGRAQLEVAVRVAPFALYAGMPGIFELLGNVSESLGDRKSADAWYSKWLSYAGGFKYEVESGAYVVPGAEYIQPSPSDRAHALLARAKNRVAMGLNGNAMEDVGALLKLDAEGAYGCRKDALELARTIAG